MEQSDIIDVMKLQLTGDGILNSELDDATLGKIVDMSLQELNRYYNATELITVDGATCVDLSKYPRVNEVMNVYRASASGISNTADGSVIDPVYTSALQMYNFGSAAYANNWIYSYGAFSSAQRTANTISTDLNWKEDKKGQKLYVNYSQGVPAKITIEYTPRLFEVSDIASDHWLDMLQRLCLAHAKVALGRIRTRFTQTNALWTGDGATILAEGTEELKDLREKMRVANDVFLPVD